MDDYYLIPDNKMECLYTGCGPYSTAACGDLPSQSTSVLPTDLWAGDSPFISEQEAETTAKIEQLTVQLATEKKLVKQSQCEIDRLRLQAIADNKKIENLAAQVFVQDEVLKTSEKLLAANQDEANRSADDATQLKAKILNLEDELLSLRNDVSDSSEIYDSPPAQMVGSFNKTAKVPSVSKQSGPSVVPGHVKSDDSEITETDDDASKEDTRLVKDGCDKEESTKDMLLNLNGFPDGIADSRCTGCDKPGKVALKDFLPTKNDTKQFAYMTVLSLHESLFPEFGPSFVWNSCSKCLQEASREIRRQRAQKRKKRRRERTNAHKKNAKH